MSLCTPALPGDRRGSPADEPGDLPGPVARGKAFQCASSASTRRGHEPVVTRHASIARPHPLTAPARPPPYLSFERAGTCDGPAAVCISRGSSPAALEGGSPRSNPVRDGRAESRNGPTKDPASLPGGVRRRSGKQHRARDRSAAGPARIISHLTQSVGHGLATRESRNHDLQLPVRPFGRGRSIVLPEA